MNTLIWVGQGLLVIIFLYSGLMKSSKTRAELVAMGQTGVEHLPLPVIRFIGSSELVGVAGLLLPQLTGILPVLTPLAALCLGVIMIPAGVIHYQRGERKAVWLNIGTLVICLVVAYGRWNVPG